MTRPIDGEARDLCTTSGVLPTLEGTVAMVKNIDGGQKGMPFICFLSAKLPCFSAPTPLPAASNAGIVICERRSKPARLGRIVRVCGK